jgi:hydroxyacylglutathione hydrolase
MFFRLVYDKGLAQASYVIGCQATGEALVIDAKRDTDTYVQIAAEEKLRITHIAETHIHADFLTGSRELARQTGAELYLSNEGGAEWQYSVPHIALRDGSSFMVGNIKIDVWHTPGHTPEHISFLITDTKTFENDVRNAKPMMMATGDFVFVGDVGRPDLLERAAGYKDTMEQGARQMFRSLQRFKTLPDYLQILPGHGAGSACGKALGAVPFSSVGYEKLTNWALRMENEEEFVEEILKGQPEPPIYFATMKAMNKSERRVLQALPKPRRYSVDDLKKAIRYGVTIVDTRGKTSFAGGHIPGSLNIQDNGSFTTWAGWMLEYNKPFVLVAPEHRVEELVRSLVRIGLDDVAGFVPDIEEWSYAGNETAVLEQVNVRDLHQMLLLTSNMELLDVRGTSEVEKGIIGGAKHIHAGFLPRRLEEIPKNRTVVVYCAGGDRSSIASSFLQQQGFKHVVNVIGGFNAWREADLPVAEYEKSVQTA